MNILLIFLCVIKYTIAIPVSVGEHATAINHFQHLAFPDENGLVIDEDPGTNPDEVSGSIKDLTFYLYTQDNKNYPDIIPAKNFNVSNTHFLSSRRNVFVAHGYLNNYNSPFNRVVKKAVLTNNDVNLFVIDWSGASYSISYSYSVDAVPVIGRLVGDIIKRLMSSYNIQPSAFDLIGHSLGAHLVGFAGKQVNGRLNSIVGLDPAGPYFADKKPDDRIKATDAKFVQIIHTSSRFGLYKSIGDADYYPNGGKTQPGCTLGSQELCSHRRAYKFFGESVLTGGFSARNCSNHSDYTSGLCHSNHESFMGRLNIDKTARGNYYLNTNDDSPFSLT